MPPLPKQRLREASGAGSPRDTPRPGASDPRWSSAWVLVGVNLIPLLGVLFGGWTLLEVVAIYWFENVLIGLINVLKMASCRPDREHFRDPIVNIAHEGAKWFLIPFFLFHYGLFCLVHGIFIFSLLGDGFRVAGGPVQLFGSMIRETVSHGGWIAALAIGASHLYSFLMHFLRGGEFRQTNVMLQMFRPYGRIVVLHVAILFGAIAILFLGQPAFLLVLLVLGKTVLDRSIHRWEHRSGGSRTRPGAAV